MLLINKTLLKLSRGLWMWITAIVLVRFCTLVGLTYFSRIIAAFLGGMTDSSLSTDRALSSLAGAAAFALLTLVSQLAQGELEYRCTAAARVRLRENIALARPSASEEEIRSAAKRAGIDDFIRTLPDGYDTQMGQMSARLSGGERQRIGIARVLLADPDILLLDEPTSALDVLREQELLEILEKEYAGRTILLISHRDSTLKFCRTRYRLENGKLEEQLPDPVST